MSTRVRMLLGLPVLLLAGCPQKTATDPIWVGHVAPFSGPLKDSGEQARRAILLAVEEANRDDQRVHGRRVAVVHPDDQGDPEAAQNQAVRLATVNKVAALLGGVNAAETERIVRTGQSYSLPVVALSALPAPPTGEGVVSLAVTPRQQGRALARVAAEELKPERVAVMTDGRDPLSTEVAAAFAKELAPDRVRELTFQGEGDFPNMIKRLQKHPPQAILVAAGARDFLKLSAQLREADVNVPLFYGGPEGELPLLRANREASQDVYAATSYLADDTTPANQEFVKKYQERFQEPPGIPAALAYDGARLLFEVMRRARVADPAEVRKELAGTERFEGLTGPLTFGKEPGAVRAVFVVRFEQGQPKLVKRFEPEGK